MCEKNHIRKPQPQIVGRLTFYVFMDRVMYRYCTVYVAIINCTQYTWQFSSPETINLQVRFRWNAKIIYPDEVKKDQRRSVYGIIKRNE